MKDSKTSYQSITKLFCIPIAVGILTSFLSSYAVSATPDETTKPGASTSAAPASASPPATEQISPEEAKKRKDWAMSMHKKAAPKKGCFNAVYPKTEWQEVPCVAAPNIPMIPRRGLRPFVVGNGDDISAEAPSGTITQAIGQFEGVTNVTSETGLIGNSGTPVNDAYTLQINTNFMTSTACSGSPNANCRGWEQFVYFNDGSAGTAFIQYWLILYNATCPAGWNTFSFSGGTDIYCWRNNGGGGVAVPNQPITNIANWTLSGTATATGDSVSMGTGATVYTRTGYNSVSAASGWTIAEFNIFGAGGSSAGGGQANFNAGASVNARTQIIYGGNAAPNCLAQGTTGETNNLSFGPTAPAATAPGPAVIFTESIAGGAASNCAAAVTIGDTHLRTFNGLFYDFQASGDFTLTEVAPGFEVQTRQVSGAPTWPDATVNKAVAARFGKTQVAICLAPPGTDQTTRVFVDGKLTPVDDGKTLELPEGTGIRRQGNVYLMAGEDGDSVRVTVNSYNSTTWIDVNVGLGRWPSAAKGLIANVNGNVNQIATRDNFVLTNPFNFDELYHRFADSWRVGEKESLLSVCNGEGAIERGIPERPFYAKDLDPNVREKALGVCKTAGVEPGALLDACTLDVAVIGQDAAAKVFVGAAAPIAVGTVVATSSRGLLWLLLLLLAIIVIVWLLVRRAKTTP
ncbi:MAG: hypothetical protein WBO23_04315 [Burkholderiales bacterium]